jgi:hypothetical protein
MKSNSLIIPTTNAIGTDIRPDVNFPDGLQDPYDEVLISNSRSLANTLPGHRLNAENDSVLEVHSYPKSVVLGKVEAFVSIAFNERRGIERRLGGGLTKSTQWISPVGAKHGYTGLELWWAVLRRLCQFAGLVHYS